jgi:hypothetical protein
MANKYNLNPNGDGIHSPLFSQFPVVKKSTPPVVVVGLPRSGSSFLSHSLCQLEDWYVFDDLYPYQRAKAFKIDVAGQMNPKQFKKLLFSLCWQARSQIKYNYDFFSTNCTLEDIDRFEQAMQTTFAEQSVYWSQFLEEWLMRLALHNHRHHWGYKTPQDFTNMDKLTDLFPGIRFIFIMRNPTKMMNSMKNLPMQKGGDGDPRQYHPIVYSLYWKMAYQKVQQFIQAGRAPVQIIKFEDLVKNPEEQAQVIADFLGTTVSTNLSIEQKNSSFKTTKQQEFTPTESWLCQQLIGNTVLHSAGYALEDVKFRIQDIPELIRVTQQFTHYQFQRFFKDKRARESIKAYFKNLFKRFRIKQKIVSGRGEITYLQSPSFCPRQRPTNK